MRDAVNETIVLDRLSEKLLLLIKRTSMSTQKLQAELEKSRLFLEGENFNNVEARIKSAVEASRAICEELLESKSYIAQLRQYINEYVKLKY